jgi:hypothetical protein
MIAGSFASILAFVLQGAVRVMAIAIAESEHSNRQSYRQLRNEPAYHNARYDSLFYGFTTFKGR